VELEGLEYVSVNDAGINPDDYISGQDANGNNQYSFSLGNESFSNVAMVDVNGSQYFDLGQHMYYGENGWSTSGTRSGQMTEESKAGIQTGAILDLPKIPQGFIRPDTYSNPQASWAVANTYLNPGGMCYAITMGRINDAYNVISGRTPLAENTKSLDYEISGTINRTVNVGYGVAGALVRNGYATLFDTDELWAGKAQKGAPIQWWWGEKIQIMNNLKASQSVIGHSIIFHSYVYGSSGDIIGFNFVDDYGYNGLPTPNKALMKNEDWIYNGFNFGRIGDQLILGGNLIDK
jgi:hypothetical protein